MKILWIVNFVLPDAAQAVGQEKIVFGGWVSEMIRELSGISDIELGVAMRSSEVKTIVKKKIKSVTYFYIPTKNNNEFDIFLQTAGKVLSSFNPDILHIEGTERLFSLRFLEQWKGENIVSMQGIINAYEPYEFGGINLFKLLSSFRVKDMLLACVFLTNKKFNFDKRLGVELKTIKLAKNIMGRTTWDRAHAYAINPEASYYYCPRNIRRAFSQFEWNIEKKEEFSLFIGNSASPRKGAHFVFYALVYLKQHFPNIKLYIAGNPPYSKSILDWKKKVGYASYLLRLIQRLEIKENIVFLGVLDEMEMAEKLSKIHVFIMASIIENSPNTLGEAMIMGVPCVSAYIGGVPDMAKDGDEALFYRDNDPELLAFQVKRILEDDKLALRLSRNTRKRAKGTHDRRKNVQLLLSAYESILQTD